ncbi:fused MFS/spermidine synthase [Sphingomonas sp. MG17]|uniref:Fused MFS/spermidine synthase n=1 Tax=Sphingomonas tagetis TaxID=2949092 RepID=A0A9X2HHM9_9SPHN|nr:fused MFS/spermidine synthase [Sphingomonas tagetis]MCP3729021.1 fused MFS/spermidine synthase [Sphingomonas tagetis]
MIGPLFVATILLGSFLLFLVQPMVARMALPRLGGAPAVWNSAMLVYQALLLGGYAYAHWLGRVPLRRQAMIHLGVLAAAALWLPLGLMAMEMPADAEPAVWVPWLLGASIGPLFFAVSAQAPLLQRWFAAASGGRDPYALYAASNVGSFGGLIAYPLLVEPGLALKGQSWLWTAGYVLVFVTVAACALLLPRKAADEPHVHATSAPPSRRRVAHWIALAFVPSGLMLATSSFLTTDIVAVPMLWVLPLGLYLLSFTIAFATRRGPAEVLTKFAPVTILMFGGLMIAGNHDNPALNAVMALGLLFMAAVALHTRMYDLRPEPDRLTGFYLAMSVGGALGGVFAGLIAPILFDWTWEYPILILAAGLLVPQSFLLPPVARLWRAEGQGYRIRVLAVALAVALVVWFGLFGQAEVLGGTSLGILYLVIAAVGMLAVGARLPFMIVLAGALFLFGGYRSLAMSWQGDIRTRSYFGVYTITDLPTQKRLAHGTTLHGVQLKGGADKLRTPTTYYVPGSGVGQAMGVLGELYGASARVGVVGLGTGTLACYAQPGQSWRFYEIDPAVVRLASGPFRFLEQCLPGANVVIGDARLRLAEAPGESLDLLVLDAFSSDAVPMHLMTLEAFRTYDRVLAKNGLLLVHISNRFLSLEPVVEAAARAGGWHAAGLTYSPSLSEKFDEAATSDWIALSRSPEALAKVQAGGGEWRKLRTAPGFTAWTDDYATILPVLRALNDDLPD